MAIVVSDNFDRSEGADLGIAWGEHILDGTGFEIRHPAGAGVGDNAMSIGGSSPSETGKHRAFAWHNTAIDSTAVTVRFSAKWTGQSTASGLAALLRVQNPTWESMGPHYHVHLAGTSAANIYVARCLTWDSMLVDQWSGLPAVLDTDWHDYELRIWTESERVAIQLLIDEVDHGCVYDTRASRILTGYYAGLFGGSTRNHTIYIDDFVATVLHNIALSTGAVITPRLARCETRIFDDFNRSSLGGLWAVETDDSGAITMPGSTHLRVDYDAEYVSAVCVTNPCPADVDIQIDVYHGSENVSSINQYTRFELRFRMPGTAYDEGPFYALMLEKTGGGISGSNAGMSLWRYAADGLLANATMLWSTDSECLTTSLQTLRVRVFDQPGSFGQSDQVLIEVHMDGDYVGEYADTSSSQVAAPAGNFVGLFFALAEPYGIPPLPDNSLHVDNFRLNQAVLPYGQRVLQAGMRGEPRIAAMSFDVGALPAGMAIAPVELVNGVNLWLTGPTVQALWVGKFRVVDPISVRWAGRSRVLDSARDRIKVWYGADAWPDLTAPPTTTIATDVGTPFDAIMPDPLPSDPTPYYFVFQRENQAGLLSAPCYFGPVLISVAGVLGEPPSPLSTVALRQMNSRMYIEAEYRPLADGDNAATHAAFWYTYSATGIPADPVVAGEPDLSVAMTHVDGLVQVSQRIPGGPWEPPGTIKVVGLSRYDSPTAPGNWVDSAPSPVVQLTAIAIEAVELAGMGLTLAGQFGDGRPA